MARRKEIEEATHPELRARLVQAIADPHIERWFLLDGGAFKEVLGKGCDAPDQKCGKDLYKQLSSRAIFAAGRLPLLGAGIEYAEALASKIDLGRVAKLDKAFEMFIADLRAQFRERPSTTVRTTSAW